MSNEGSTELRFSPGFAARVLEEADRIAGHRQRVARTSVLVAVAATTGVVAFAVWNMVGSRAPIPAMPSAVVANAGVEEMASSEAAQTEPLDYMFPDATPLAQFADRYSNAATGGAAARRNMLFAEETGEDRTR